MSVLKRLLATLALALAACSAGEEQAAEADAVLPADTTSTTVEITTTEQHAETTATEASTTTTTTEPETTAEAPEVGLDGIPADVQEVASFYAESYRTGDLLSVAALMNPECQAVWTVTEIAIFRDSMIALLPEGVDFESAEAVAEVEMNSIGFISQNSIVQDGVILSQGNRVQWNLIDGEWRRSC